MAVAAGRTAGLMLRFEFMNTIFIKGMKAIEMVVWCYVLIRGTDMVMY